MKILLNSLTSYSTWVKFISNLNDEIISFDKSTHARNQHRNQNPKFSCTQLLNQMPFHSHSHFTMMNIALFLNMIKNQCKWFNEHTIKENKHVKISTKWNEWQKSYSMSNNCLIYLQRKLVIGNNNVIQNVLKTIDEKHRENDFMRIFSP